VDVSRREDAGKRTGGRDRIGYLDIAKTGEAPHYLHARVKVYGVDEESAGKVREGGVTHQTRD
jgi:hypothetical protein